MAEKKKIGRPEEPPKGKISVSVDKRVIGEIRADAAAAVRRLERAALKEYGFIK